MIELYYWDLTSYWEPGMIRGRTRYALKLFPERLPWNPLIISFFQEIA